MILYQWKDTVRKASKNELVLGDGTLKNFTRIRDNIATFFQFKEKEEVDILIIKLELGEFSSTTDIFTDKTRIIGVVTEVLNNAIVLKNYNLKESVFLKKFWHDERGFMVNEPILSGEHTIEMGDIIEILIKKYETNETPLAGVPENNQQVN